jgi:hypothetical protein
MSPFVFDEQFVDELQKQPGQVLEDLGIEPTDELVEAIGRLDTEALMVLAREYRLAHKSKADVQLVFP